MLSKKGLASIAFYLISAMSLPALASPPMATGAAVVAPRGFIGFCLKYQLECRVTSSPPAAVELTEDRYQQLEFAQAKVNRLVRPRANPDHVWDYPTDGYGDCNNYAIAKRAELICPRLTARGASPGGG